MPQWHVDYFELNDLYGKWKRGSLILLCVLPEAENKFFLWKVNSLHLEIGYLYPQRQGIQAKKPIQKLCCLFNFLPQTQICLASSHFEHPKPVSPANYSQIYWGFFFVLKLWQLTALVTLYVPFLWDLMIKICFFFSC